MKWRSQGFLENTQRSLALFDTYGDGALNFDLGTAEYCRKMSRLFIEYLRTVRKCEKLRLLVIVLPKPIFQHWSPVRSLEATVLWQAMSFANSCKIHK